MWVGVRAKLKTTAKGKTKVTGKEAWSVWVGKCAREGVGAEDAEVDPSEKVIDEDEDEVEEVDVEVDVPEKGVADTKVGNSDNTHTSTSLLQSQSKPPTRTIKALHTHVPKSLPRWLVNPRGTPLHVLLDGPYGGCSVIPGEFESVLLVAGGSGATFTLGILDDLVGRIVRLGRCDGERTRRIEFVWCVRSFGKCTTLMC